MTNYEDASALVFNYIEYSTISTIAEIELLVSSMSLAGATPDAIRQVLLNDLTEKGRIFGAYTNGLTKATSLGITSSGQIAEMLEYINAGYTEYKWVTVSKKPCPQCAERAGRVELKEFWEAVGYPRSGFSVCGSACKCHLVPYNYAGKDTIIME